MLNTEVKSQLMPILETGHEMQNDNDLILPHIKSLDHHMRGTLFFSAMKTSFICSRQIVFTNTDSSIVVTQEQQSYMYSTL